MFTEGAAGDVVDDVTHLRNRIGDHISPSSRTSVAYSPLFIVVTHDVVSSVNR